jgi:hypothetical protein
MDVNKWMSFESSDEGTYTLNIHNSSSILVPHIHQKSKIALEAEQSASVNGPENYTTVYPLLTVANLNFGVDRKFSFLELWGT